MGMLSRFLRVDPKAILNSQQSLTLVQRLSRLVPPAAGYRAGYLIADWVGTHRDWDRVKAVRCNQWMVRGRTLAGTALDQAVRETFRDIAHSVYDVYHYANDPESVDRLIEFSPAIQKIIAQSQASEGAKILLALHLGNFDLALQVLTQRGLRSMVFVVPPTEGGYRVQYRIRQSAGVDAYPIDMNALRQAITRLKEGGTVIAAADWPVPDSKHSPCFFGQPSAAPVHYVYLALKARVPVVFLFMLRRTDGTYHFIVSEPILMQEYPDRQEGLVRNAEGVLRLAEEFLRQTPEQWAMSHPVWPELMDQVPD
jgi:lauroyl/myristoyl acyltransferase